MRRQFEVDSKVAPKSMICMIVRTGETFALKKISCMEGVQVQSSVRAARLSCQLSLDSLLVSLDWKAMI